MQALVGKGALIALVAIGLGAFYWLGSLTGAQNARDAITTASSQTLLDVGKAYRDALKRETAKQGLADQARRRWRDSARSLEREARQGDSSMAARPADSVTVSEWSEAVERWRAAANVREAESKECSLAIVHCDARATLAERRADTLALQLAAQVEVSRCQINLVVVRPACPGWVTAGVIGTALGVVGASFVGR